MPCSELVVHMIITRLCYGDQTAAATDCWLVAKAAWHEGRCTMLANLRCDDRCWRSTCTELVDYLDLGADLQVGMYKTSAKSLSRYANRCVNSHEISVSCTGLFPSRRGL